MRVAAFQCRPLFDDVPGTVARIQADLEWCQTQSINLAVYPECSLQGYGLDRDVLARRALNLQGEVFSRIVAQLASPTTIVLGMVERDGELLYNTAAILRGGALLGRYRKHHPNERAFAAGHDVPVWSAGDGLSFGVNICNDANFPQTAQRVADAGARVLCYPLNNMLPPDVAERWRERSPENLRLRALQTGCWVVSSDVVGRSGPLYSHGCTRIVGPDGETVAAVPEGEEGRISWTLT